MSESMDPLFAASLRQELVDQVRTTKRRRMGWRIGGALAGVVLAGTGAAAVATSQSPGLGMDQVQVVKAGTRVEGTGTRTIDLGDPPKGATDIEVVFFCLTSGSYSVGDIGRLTCSNIVAGQSEKMSASVPVQRWGRHVTVQADPGARWTFTASFSKHTPTEFGVNADGKTFGGVTEKGTPDLVAVIATNHREGYAYAKDLEGPMPKNPAAAPHRDQTHGGELVIPVYTSDGHTVIGQFVLD